MATSVVFNGTTYSIPASGETGWSSLSNFLIDLATYASTNQTMKSGMRVVTGTSDSFNSTTDFCIGANHSAPLALTLPTGVNGKIFACVDISSAGAATNNITISGTGGQTINGSSSYVINKNKAAVSFEYSTTASDWKVISASCPTVSFPTTASKALATDSNGFPTPSAVTATELGYVAGVTSAIQTQINSKEPSITGAATSIVSSNLTASKALISNSSGKVAVSSVTDTELAYVSGVTSAIQTQLNAKASLTGAETLTNKYYQGGTASTSNRLKLPSDTAANLATLAASLTAGDMVFDTTNNQINYKAASSLAVLAAAVDASPSQTGNVNTSAQSFGGLKKFEGGLVDVGTVSTADTNQTLTNSSSRNITYTSFTASRDVSLPTTTILAGEVFRISNTTNFALVLKASGGTTVATFASGAILVKALQNTPTANTHWEILDYSNGTVVSSATSSSITSATKTGLTNISLTPGSWLVSCIFAATNATGNIQDVRTWISSTSAGGTESLGDNQAIDDAGSGSSKVVTVPNYPVTVTSTTTYYLNCYSNGTATVTGWGRITAVKTK